MSVVRVDRFAVPVSGGDAILQIGGFLERLRQEHAEHDHHHDRDEDDEIVARALGFVLVLRHPGGLALSSGSRGASCLPGGAPWTRGWAWWVCASSGSRPPRGS